MNRAVDRSEEIIRRFQDEVANLKTDVTVLTMLRRAESGTGTVAIQQEMQTISDPDERRRVLERYRQLTTPP